MITSSQSSAIGPWRFAVTSHFGPANARAASSVSAVSPSWLTSTSTSASAATAPPRARRRPDRPPSAPRGTTCRSRRRRRDPPAAAGRSAPEPATPAAPRRPSASSPATGASIPWPAMGVFERHSLSNGLRVLCADAARAVGLLLRDARCGLPLRDGGDERDRPAAAHVLQGDRAAADGPRHRRRDRRDRGASSMPSPARSTPATTSAAPPKPATRHSTSSSTCSATPSSTPRRSSARRA